MQSARTQPPIAAETISQAGAGMLLAGVAVTELLLGSWGAGWWPRAGACLIALAGAALVARALAGMRAPAGTEPRAGAREAWAPQHGAHAVPPLAAPAPAPAGTLRADSPRVGCARAA